MCLQSENCHAAALQISIHQKSTRQKWKQQQPTAAIQMLTMFALLTLLLLSVTGSCCDTRMQARCCGACSMKLVGAGCFKSLSTEASPNFCPRAALKSEPIHVRHGRCLLNSAVVISTSAAATRTCGVGSASGRSRSSGVQRA